MNDIGADRAEALIAAILRGGEAAWDSSGPEAEWKFLDACGRHGVSALVDYRLKRSPAWPEWPETIRRELAGRAAGNSLLQALAERDLASVLSEAARRGVRPLILKGAALAHTHYPSPHLRPRGDTDLLIAELDRPPMEEIVSALGYRRADTHPGELVLFQSNFVRTDPNGFSHSFDLHWKISNAHVFSKTFEFGELSGRAEPVPALGSDARACNPIDALALACLHRVGHHANSQRMIWLCDIHLLAEGLDADQQNRWLDLALEKSLGAVCLDGVRAAGAVFGGKAALRLADRLAQRVTPGEPGAALLKESQRRIDVLASDLRSLPGWSGKLRLALQHLFPPPAFMLKRYGLRSRLWLPLLYPHRAARGLRRLFAKSPSREG